MSASRRLLQCRILRSLVRSKALVGRRPQLPSARHLQELHLAHELRLHEARPLDSSKLGVVDRRLLALQWLESLHEVIEHPIGESRSDLSDPPETSIIVP